MKTTRTLFLCLIVGMLFLGSQSVSAQNLMNDASGVVINNATGIIRFANDNARFINTQATITNIVNNGVFESTGANFQFAGGATALGTSASFRVPGLTRYSSGGTVQTVYAAYYENLSVSNASVKTLPTGIFVGSTNAGNGFYTATGGARNYGGLFTYDGSVAQNVWAGETYNNLNFENAGGKTLTAGTVSLQTNVAGTFTQLASATGTQTILGILNLGSGVSSLQAGSGQFVVGDGSNGNGAGNPGTVRVGASDFIMSNASTRSLGLVMTTTASGRLVVGTSNTFSLDPSGGTSGSVFIGANQTMTVTGTFQNTVAGRTNMWFDQTSTVHYNGAVANQPIVSTVDIGAMTANAGNLYGNLRLQNSVKQVTTTNAFLGFRGDLSVTGGNFEMTTANVTLVATNANSLVAFGGTTESALGNEEIVGRFLRNTTVVRPYVFNNRATRMEFTSGTNPTEMTVTMIPGTATSDYSASTDVRRLTNISYATNSTNWFGTLQVGYLRSETGATTSINRLLMLNDPPLTGNAVKYGTGQSYNRDIVSTSLASVSLGGFRPTGSGTTNSLAVLANGNDLLLSSRPVQVVSVIPGRWSNPQTWDIGEQPFPTDDVLIRHTVHGGFTRPLIDNFSTDENAAPGRSATSLANSIEIAAPGAGFLTPSLLWGNTGALNLFRTSQNAIVWNRAGTAAVADNQATVAGNNSLYVGLVVFGGTTFRTANLYNNGAITNSGLIDVSND